MSIINVRINICSLKNLITKYGQSFVNLRLSYKREAEVNKKILATVIKQQTHTQNKGIDRYRLFVLHFTVYNLMTMSEHFDLTSFYS